MSIQVHSTTPVPATALARLPEGPRGELAARTLAMPADTNPAGDIFGGWIMSFMDAVGGITATRWAQGRVVTVAVTDMAFLQPVKVGDVVCCYTDPVRLGRSSLTLNIEVWVLRQGRGERVRVTAAEFTFVALDESGKPRPIPRDNEMSEPRFASSSGTEAA
jgi:acyl-CoA thioesterase YciA